MKNIASSENLQYPMKGFTPLVIESFRKITFQGKTFSRRLRISRFNAFMIDEVIGTFVGRQTTQFVVLDMPDIEKACKILGIEFKPVETYFCIDTNMCSFKTGPGFW
jgi:hypothetical protein